MSDLTEKVKTEIPDNTDQAVQVTLKSVLSRGWTSRTSHARYPVRAHEVYPLSTTLYPPSREAHGWHEIVLKAEINGQQLETVKVRVFVGIGSMDE